MGKLVGSRHSADEPVPHESSLVPNSKMQQMYEGIVSSRMLGDALEKRHRKAKLPTTRGQEACRVSAVVDLDSEDLVSDLPGVLITTYLRGAGLQFLLDYVNRQLTLGKHPAPPNLPSLPGLLPAITDTAERLRLALGTALAFKHLKLTKVVVIFTLPGDLKSSAWKSSLQFAAQETLAILFVLLPDSAAKSVTKPVRGTSFSTSAHATALGVPGIPVDSSDAVALYRVAQESIGRARAGGGPALMECVACTFEGQKKKLGADPVVAMGRTLLARRIQTEAGLAKVAFALKTKLDAL